MKTTTTTTITIKTCQQGKSVVHTITQRNFHKNETKTTQTNKTKARAETKEQARKIKGEYE